MFQFLLVLLNYLFLLFNYESFLFYSWDIVLVLICNMLTFCVYTILFHTLKNTLLKP